MKVETLEEAAENVKVKCIRNDWNMPYIEVGEIYTVVALHPTRDDYWEVRAEKNTRAFYKKEWFELFNLSGR